MKPVRHERFRCRVSRLEYDFSARRGVLTMAPGNVPDMGGTIGVFREIDSDVESIVANAGAVLEVIYEKRANGEWTARP